MENVELESGYEVLSRDERGDISIKYTLTSIPPEKWTRVFNRTRSNVNSMSIRDSATIIVVIDPATFYKNGIREKLQAKIEKVNLEVFSDDQKIAIILESSSVDSNGNLILDNWTAGMIVVHLRGELSYTEANIYDTDVNPDEFPDYKFYIRSIAESLNLSNY